MSPKPQSRRLRRPLTVLAACISVILSLFVSGASGASPLTMGPAAADTSAAPTASQASNATPGASTSVEITLITGDRVRYEAGPDGQQQVTVVDAVSTDFRGEEPPDGGVYLYPDVAEPYIASGVLDQELFNIEYLATHGYSDGETKRLPLIVDYAGSGHKVAARAESDADGLAASEIGHVLESIGATGVSVDKAHADQFWESLAPQPEAAEGLRTETNGSLAAGELASSVDKVWLDRKVTVTLDESVSLIGAPDAWAAGYDGTGVTVAVLDTGIDATHPDLEGTVVTSKSFVSDTAEDGHGHGTHVASTIVGSGAASDGRYKGVAPGADLVVGKVLDDGGSGTFAQIVAGMEWAAQEQDADVISMSLGAEGDSLDGTDPASQAVNSLTASTGALFVIAAGNSGNEPQTVQTPAVADAALTVAASQESDVIDPIARFSSRGPRVDGVLKPDIAAPGVNIVAARAAGTSLCENSCIPGDGPVDEFYASASGTSMATPHVAGAAAILAQQHPDWTAEQLKTTLMSTSLGLTKLFGNLPPPTAYAQGAGRVDVARAVNQQLRTDTASISPGILELDEPPRSVPVTYLNDSADELTVMLEATLRGPDEQPAADGVLSLDQDTLTLPPGGSATVTVTIDVTAATEFGVYDGVITAATGAGDSLRTPIGVTIQPPLNDLTVRLVTFAPELRLDPRSWSALRIDDQQVPWAAPIVWEGVNQGNQVIEGTTRVPDGSYFVSGVLDWVAQSYRQSAWVAEEVTVDGDTVITIDMHDLVPVTASADQPTELVWRTENRGIRTEAGRSHTSFTIRGLPATHREWRYPIEPVSRGELWVREGFILSQPQLLLDLRAGGSHTVLQPHYPDQPASPEDRYPRFTRDTDTVLATEADLDAGRDVRDALVLMALAPQSEPFEPCPGGTPDPFCAVVNRAQKAAEAGAAGVLFALEEGVFMGGLNMINDERFVSQLPVPVLWLDDTQADQVAGLLDSGKPVKVRMDVNLEPAYEYKLWFRESGQVPADMSYEVNSRDLKRVDTSYHGTGSAEAGLNNAYETMHAHWPGENLSFATVRYFDAPTRRVEYYRPTGPEVVHSLGHNVFYAPGASRNGVNWRTLVGTAPESTAWGTVATPGQILLDGITRDDAAFGTCAVCRQGDQLWVRPRASMGSGNLSWTVGYGNAVRLFDAGGSEIPAAGVGAFPLPPESGRYRLEHVQTDQGTDNLYGREVRTEWEFTATARPEANEVEFPYGKPDFFDPAPAAWQPVIFLNYDLPLELDNTAPAGRPVWIDVYAAAGKPGSGDDIAGLEFQASFDDGQTWAKPLALRPMGDGAFRVLIKHPELSQTTGAVTLRARAWDQAGNEVTQTVERAYGLR